MLGPIATTHAEKLTLVQSIKERWLANYGDKTLAIGVYGSLARGTDGPYSDIEMHIIYQDDTPSAGFEIVYTPFKVELNVLTKQAFWEQAASIDDAWPIKAGSYVDILAVYDPQHLFEQAKTLPWQATDQQIKEVMQTFMVWEPYETIAKLRNNHIANNLDYIPLGAKDLAWQTATLMSLANRQYYTTRATTWAESLCMPNQPLGYKNLARAMMSGNLSNRPYVYSLCEDLWVGLNSWFTDLNITYTTSSWPF